MTQSSCVLIAEDEIVLAEMLAYNLEHAGYCVLTAPAAAPALELLRSDATVDLLFTDIQMPGGMDGQMLAKLARELRPDLAVVYASGRYNRLSELDAVPDSSFVAKPFLPSVARAAIEAALSRRAVAMERLRA